MHNTGLNSCSDTCMRYFLDPFGCAKNQVDAEIMMASLNEAGWVSADDPADADLIIVNSCGFIEAAKRESINAVLAWKKLYPQKKILLAGCLTQRYRTELEESLTEADGFLGCEELDTIPLKAAKLFKPILALPNTSVFQSRGLRPLLGFPGSAYVKISEGCNNNCTFCAIPLIRGPLRCRAIPDIVEECRQLLERGVKELCLIGQDLASFKYVNDEPDTNGVSAVAALLKAIAGLPGNFWVRLLYLHPDHFPPDILDIAANDSRFLPYFDIPFQHASPKILSLMGRKGNAESYLGLLETIRTKLPDAVIRSTFLVGFPGETEEDFKALLDFQKKACFNWLGVFAYSREDQTPAYLLKGRVSKKLAAQRKAFIEEKQLLITEKKMNRFVGRTMDVLVEEAVDNVWLGRLFCHAPEVDGTAIIKIADPVKNAGNLMLLPKPGGMVQGRVVARSGFDLEVLVPSAQ